MTRGRRRMKKKKTGISGPWTSLWTQTKLLLTSWQSSLTKRLTGSRTTTSETRETDQRAIWTPLGPVQSREDSRLLAKRKAYSASLPIVCTSATRVAPTRPLNSSFVTTWHVIHANKRITNDEDAPPYNVLAGHSTQPAHCWTAHVGAQHEIMMLFVIHNK